MLKKPPSVLLTLTEARWIGLTRLFPPPILTRIERKNNMEFMETYEISGKEYPVIGYSKSRVCGAAPVVDLPQMSDEEWNRKARENAVRNYARTFGHLPETVEEAVEWQRETVRTGVLG